MNFKVEKGHIAIKVWCLKSFFCTDLSDEQRAFDGLWKIIIYSFINVLSLHLNEFVQSEIKQKLSSVQKITCITATADKKTLIVVCVCGVLCFPPQSAVFLESIREEKKI